MSGRDEEDRGAADNSGEASSRSRAVPRRIGFRDTPMHGNKRFSNRPRRDQMGSACPLLGTVWSCGTRFIAESQHKK